MPKTHETREGWLRDLTEGLRPILRERADIKLPKNVLVSCGWPSRGGTARVKKRIGECWVASPGTPIFISPVVVTPFEVAAVHAHELIHSALPKGTGHRAPFARAALAMNLGGKPTATTRTTAFDDLLRPILSGLGPYPHKKIDYSERKKQGTRMLKLACQDCTYTIRTTQKWVDAGMPTCVCGGTFELEV